MVSAGFGLPGSIGVALGDSAVARHWHRCERWWRNGIPCPFGLHEEFRDEDEDSAGEGEAVRPPLTRQVMKAGAGADVSATKALVMAAMTGALAAVAGQVKTQMGMRSGSSPTRPTTFAVAEKLLSDTAGRYKKSPVRAGGYGGKLFKVADFMSRSRKLLSDPSSVFDAKGWVESGGL